MRDHVRNSCAGIYSKVRCCGLWRIWVGHTFQPVYALTEDGAKIPQYYFCVHCGELVIPILPGSDNDDGGGRDDKTPVPQKPEYNLN